MSGRSSTPRSASTACRLRLRSDNGPPFATVGAGGLSRLAVNVIKAGRGPRAHPPRQAAGERPARADAPDAAPRDRRPAGRDPASAAARFRAFCRVYNEERPHAALDNATPAERYASIAATLGRGAARARARAARDAPGAPQRRIKWRGGAVHIGEALTGEAVGLAETEDGRWTAATARCCWASSDARGERLLRPPTQKKRAVEAADNAARSPQLHSSETTEAAWNIEECHPCRRSEVSSMSPVAQPDLPTVKSGKAQPPREDHAAGRGNAVSRTGDHSSRSGRARSLSMAPARVAAPSSTSATAAAIGSSTSCRRPS